MLSVYVNKCEEDIVLFNDVYFNKFTFRKLDLDIARDIIKEIDEVDLTDDFKIVSKFTQGVLDLSKLSTGCKTVLNIVFHQDKVFCIDECGMNALVLLYKLSVGKCYTEELTTPVVSNINCDIEVMLPNISKRFSSVSDMRAWCSEVCV